MTSSFASGRRRDEHGIIILELLLIVPIVVFMGFCAIEFTRILRIQQAMGAMGREIANESFRTCSTESEAEPRGCLTSVVAHVQRQVAAIVPNTMIRVSLWEIRKTVAAGSPTEATFVTEAFSTTQPPASVIGEKTAALKAAVDPIAVAKVEGRNARVDNSGATPVEVPVIAPVIAVEIVHGYMPSGPVRDWAGRAYIRTDAITHLYDATVF